MDSWSNKPKPYCISQNNDCSNRNGKHYSSLEFPSCKDRKKSIPKVNWEKISCQVFCTVQQSGVWSETIEEAVESGDVTWSEQLIDKLSPRGHRYNSSANERQSPGLPTSLWQYLSDYRKVFILTSMSP